MKTSILEKLGIERVFIVVIIIAIIGVFALVVYLFWGYSAKKIELVSPLGREEWEIGQTYEIKWDSQGIERIGIVLFNGEKPEWVAEGISPYNGAYSWKIQPGHDYGSNFWIAVFEYPWRNGNPISYSKGSFSITFPEQASCDSLSVSEEWPFLASDYPNVRKVFLTRETFRGDLNGLEGADDKCQVAAAELGLEGDWSAFIGGELPENTAVNRLSRTPRGLEGIFVDAEASSELLRGATCHRVLGKDFNEFLAKLSSSQRVNEIRFSEDFLEDIEEVWLGRVDDTSKRSCVFLGGISSGSVSEKYSFTVTCQDWNYSEKLVEGYSRYVVPDERFPLCYTPQGEPVYAVGSAGLSTSLSGEKDDLYLVITSAKQCSDRQHLLCIQD